MQRLQAAAEGEARETAAIEGAFCQGKLVTWSALSPYSAFRV